MADSASEMESDTSSVDGAQPHSRESMLKRVESLQQENRVLRMEIETLKLKNKTLQEENKELRRASVNIQARAEQEEEYISNTLLKKIQALKKEKEMLAVNYEQEEEHLTNDLTRKLTQLRNEKVQLEHTLEKEQEAQVNKLLKRIQKLENDISQKQLTLEQLRREKVELENSLEQEQESLVNRLWKRMDKLEVEKRILQEKLDQPISAPPSPRNGGERDINTLTRNVVTLRQEVTRYRNMLVATQQQNAERMAALMEEERHMKEENLRLQRKLQLEMERREALCRHLSESESSLEMDDERHFNEMAKQHDIPSKESGRGRTVSSPIPYQTATPAKPISPHIGGTVSPPNPIRCNACGHTYSTAGSHGSGMMCSFPTTQMSSSLPSTSPPTQFFHLPSASGAQQPRQSRSSGGSVGTGDKFMKPASTSRS